MPTMMVQKGQNDIEEPSLEQDIEEPPLVDRDLPTGDDYKVDASDSVPDWDSIPKPSVTSAGSIRKSKLGAKSQEIFDKIKTRNNQSQITIEDAFEVHQQSEEKDVAIKKLKYALCGMFIMVILCAAAAFSSTFAAVNLSKESHVSGGAMVGIDPVTNNKAIVQVAQATDSKLNLYHALVLDEAHLRTMDEIVYSYYPDNGETKATRTDKVFRVERLVGKDPSDVNVTITLYDNTKVVIAPKEFKKQRLRLFTDGKSYPLCGAMRCANFMVDDADLDLDVLNHKVDIIMGEVSTRRLLEHGSDPDVRRLESGGTNYGCCSTGTKFILGKALKWDGPGYADSAKCAQNEKGPAGNPDLHRSDPIGIEVSSACYCHDICLTACEVSFPGGCSKCKKECDVDLESAMKEASCGDKYFEDNCWSGWWSCYLCVGPPSLLWDKAACTGFRELMQSVMGGTPNGCKDTDTCTREGNEICEDNDKTRVRQQGFC